MTKNEYTEIPCYSNDCNSVNRNNLQHCDSNHHENCDNHAPCHRPLRLWSFKYVIVGTSKFVGQALVQAPTLKEAECILGKDSRFNGFPDRIKITCIEEILPNNEPILLQEDSVAILDKAVLKSYPFVLKSDIDCFFKNLHDEVVDIKETLVSPTLTETKTEDGYDITIKDADGEREISIKNGEKGEKGDTGEKGDDGKDGINGSTFTPNVDENGIITWTNDGGLENPQSVNIKGVKGDNGITPHIGVNGNWYIGDTDTGVPSQAHFIDDTVTTTNKTWSSSKIQQKLDSIDLANFKVVDELPTEDISSNVIYLVPKPNSENENIKDEYVYEEDHWELIGDTSIDLSEYITNDILNEKLAEYKNLKAGIATEIKDNKINVRYDPEFLMVDEYNRLTLKYKIKAWLDMDEEEGGGSSGGDEPSPDIPTPTIYDSLKQIYDLDTYEAEVEEIVQYIGPTTNKYINGYTYQYKPTGVEVDTLIGAKTIIVNEGTFLQSGIYHYVEDTDNVDINILNLKNPGARMYSSPFEVLGIGDKIWDDNGSLYTIKDKSTSPTLVYITIDYGGNDLLLAESIANSSPIIQSCEKYINNNGDVIYRCKGGTFEVNGNMVTIPESIGVVKEKIHEPSLSSYSEDYSNSDYGFYTEKITKNSGKYTFTEATETTYKPTYEWVQKDVQPDNSQDNTWINI